MASVAAGTDNSYQLGTVIQFGTGGASERFRQSGWSTTEKLATWTIGDSAKLVFSIPPTDQALNLRMRLSGLLKAPELMVQPVTVFANGEKIADWEVSMPADFTAVIPAATVKDGGLLTIDLKTAKATSPKSLGLSEDQRVLGVLCSEVAITANP